MTSPYGILGRAFGTGPLGGLKRYLRWFNLTMLQQALWPLLIAVASAPQVDLEDTPADWFLLRLAGPAIAVLVALLYLRTSPSVTSPFTATRGPSVASPFMATVPSTPNGPPDGVASPATTRFRPATMLRMLISPPAAQRAPAAATQVRYALLALPIVISVLRLVIGPADEAAKIIVFGCVNVVAYHLIHFGIVPQSFDDRRQGLLAGAVLFGLSWGIHNALMFGLSDGGWLPGLAAGLVLGWLFGFGSLALQRWPGGWLTGAAVQLLVVYLIAGFV